MHRKMNDLLEYKLYKKEKKQGVDKNEKEDLEK
jgi:hypothetical protein